jgi:hypothetical protein
MVHLGKCFCGAVEPEVDGKPEAIGLLSLPLPSFMVRGPVNAFRLWKPAAVRITLGAEYVG